MGKPIDNTPCHCLKLHRSAENVITYYNKILSAAGLTVRQFSILAEIRLRRGCTLTELAKATELDVSTVNRNLKPLFRRGLIVDRKKPGARNSSIVVTEEGKQVFRQGRDLWCQAQRDFEERLGPEGVRALEDALLVLQTM